MANSDPLGGLSSNVAGALSYVLVFITGIIFFLLSKDKFVRFHAMQSILTSVGIMLINWVLKAMRLYSLSSLVSLATLILFIFLIVKAYQGAKFKLPVIGDMAEKYA